MKKESNIRVDVWKARGGMTLRQLERITGISKTTLNRIENNQKSPTLKQLELISIATGTNIINLFSLQT